MNRPLQILSLALTAALAACASTGKNYAVKSAAKSEPAPATWVRPCAGLPTTPESRFECDRRSILAMAGEFRVRFAFDETAALAPGYATREPKRSGGTEWVEVIEDRGDFISLQHILVMKFDDEVHVVKHWRQDWQYQPDHILSFHGGGRFEREAVSAEAAAGHWAQTVYEVDDAPRYAGLGTWSHADGMDAWTSEPTLRPLPRREYTTRSDYQAILATNRHALTPAGWIHEQDNTKLVIDADGTRHAIAREVGTNSYNRIGDFDFSAGRDYWTRTAAYWARVRGAWERAFAAQPSFVLNPHPNGEPRIEKLLEQAERSGKGEAVSDAEINAVLVEAGMQATTTPLASQH